MEESQHFRDMLDERHVPHEWVDRAMLAPDKTEDHEDGTRHYLRRIPEYGDRWLRLVVNAETQRTVTVFFDRRLESRE